MRPTVFRLLTSLAMLALGIRAAPAADSIERVEKGLREFGPPSEMLSTVAPPDALHPLADRMTHYKIPGVSIALIDDFQFAWARGYGTLAVGRDDPVTPATLFEAASTTKFLVAALALQLVEQGRLDLDADVNASLDAWQIPENEFTAEEKVTLRRLLSHQSGLNRPEGGFSSEGGNPTLIQTLSGAKPALNPAAEILAVPGSGWSYSNFGYLVVQLLVEETMGAPFSAVARENLFEPLGMNSSTFVVPLSEHWARREALPHDPEGNAHAAQLDPNAVANGGLMTTPTDLALFTVEFLQSCRGKSKRLLSRATAREMLEPGAELGPMLGFPMSEGLGVFVCGARETLTFLHPGDNIPGASCFLLGFPERGDGVIIMTNGAKGNMLALEILYSITQEYGWPTSQYEMPPDRDGDSRDE